MNYAYGSQGHVSSNYLLDLGGVTSKALRLISMDKVEKG